MASLNKVALIGNVGKPPEFRSFQNGGRICSFSVATSERWKDKGSGDYKERTEWHRVSVLSDLLVGRVEQYIQKGAKIYIEGQLETREFLDKDGKKAFITEVVLRPHSGKIILLDKRQGDAGGNSAKSVDDLDDEIPF